MRHDLRITVDGRTYNVTVETATSTTETFYPSPAMRSEVLEPSIAAAPPPPPVSDAGAPPVAAGASDIVSPMTGVLADYTVKLGETVKAGQQVAVIEAMKMKTAIVAEAAGTVARLHLEPGAAVDTGQVLLSLS